MHKIHSHGAYVFQLFTLYLRQHLLVYSPADLRGALSTIAEKTRDSQRAETRQKKSLSSSTPKMKPAKKDAQAFDTTLSEEYLPSYHFVGYVPAHGRVWELDGLKSGPLEVGELDSAEAGSTQGWEDVVRPALRFKMEKYGGGGDEGGNIRFNLLAIVKDRYEQKSDQLELLKRERKLLERRLDDAFPTGWKDKVPAYECHCSLYTSV